jgi:hypothetical protein
MIEFHDVWRRHLHRDGLIDGVDAVIDTHRLGNYLQRFLETLTC